MRIPSPAYLKLDNIVEKEVTIGQNYTHINTGITTWKYSFKSFFNINYVTMISKDC